MSLRLKTLSYRFAEQILNSKLSLKEEITDVTTDPTLDIGSLSRPNFNSELVRLGHFAPWAEFQFGHGKLPN